MLDAFVIEEIRRRERERGRDERPAVQIPPPGPSTPGEVEQPDDGSDRGIVIIDYG